MYNTILRKCSVVRYEENLLRNRKKVLMAVPDFIHPYGGQQDPLQKINYFAELGRKKELKSV